MSDKVNSYAELILCKSFFSVWSALASTQETACKLIISNRTQKILTKKMVEWGKINRNLDNH